MAGRQYDGRLGMTNGRAPIYDYQSTLFQKAKHNEKCGTILYYNVMQDNLKPNILKTNELAWSNTLSMQGKEPFIYPFQIKISSLHGRQILLKWMSWMLHRSWMQESTNSKT